MNSLQKSIFLLAFASLVLAGCKNMNKTQKGAAIGTAGGAAAGAVIGRAAGNTALGAIIGAAVGGVTGAVIGRKMDKQAEEIEKNVPGAKVERVGEGIVVDFSEKILFAYDRSDLNTSATSNLNKLVDILNEYPDTNIEIQGHTDSKGSDDYNMRLSERRASEVSSYLRTRGVAGPRMTTKGYGESAPVADNNTDDGRAQNRRVTFLITANQKMVDDAKKEAAK
ncbi:MAG: OmpA family protein [Chitinophagaceae bacterium]|nr:OmpA family protein [Chitinophagaceae bacterium]